MLYPGCIKIEHNILSNTIKQVRQWAKVKSPHDFEFFSHLQKYKLSAMSMITKVMKKK